MAGGGGLMSWASWHLSETLRKHCLAPRKVLVCNGSSMTISGDRGIKLWTEECTSQASVKSRKDKNEMTGLQDC